MRCTTSTRSSSASRASRRSPALVAELGVAEPLLLQSMYIFKQPRIGGEVGCHQDASFLIPSRRASSACGSRSRTPRPENGCLYAAPGGHKGPLRSRFVRHDIGGRTTGPRWSRSIRRRCRATGLVPLEVPKGTLVVLHGLLPHWSAPNRSARSRHAYTLHVIDGRCA